MPLQLWPRGPLREFTARIARAAGAGLPGFDPAHAQTTLDLMLRCRASQNEACGTLAACSAPGNTPVAGERPFVIDRDDARELANIFAAALAAKLELPSELRRLAERRIVATTYDLLAPLVVENPRCRRTRGCRSPSRDPFQP